MKAIVINTQNVEEDPRIIWCGGNIYTNDNKELSYEIIDNKLIIYGNIIIPDDLEELDIKIDEVFGNVVLANTINKKVGHFKSLKNFPTVIHGNVDISNNPDITSFNGEIKRIDGYFKCNTCGFTTAAGFPESVGSMVKMFNNPLTDISDLLNVDIKLVDIDFAKIPYIDKSYQKLVNENKITSYTPGY